MKLEYREVTDEEAAAALEGLNGWSIEEGKLCKLFEFGAYLEGVSFAAGVGFLAEKLDHHPDLEIGWRKVRVSMSTHAVKGLSPYDFELARRIEQMV